MGLPELGVPSIKAKVDTGARSSAIHAFGIEIVDRGGVEWARFTVQPLQRSSEPSIAAEAPIDSWRVVKSSNGVSEERPTIVTNMRLFDRDWPIELTLTHRDQMGFRMLLGRQAIRRRFLVDPGRSYCGARPPQRRLT